METSEQVKLEIFSQKVHYRQYALELECPWLT